MFLLWIGLIYLLIGAIWSVWVTLAMLDTFSNVKEGVCCLACNVLFWPLIMILAVAAGKMFKGLGGH